jgi:hypothetical protein
MPNFIEIHLVILKFKCGWTQTFYKALFVLNFEHRKPKKDKMSMAETVVVSMQIVDLSQKVSKTEKSSLQASKFGPTSILCVLWNLLVSKCPMVIM